MNSQTFGYSYFDDSTGDGYRGYERNLSSLYIEMQLQSAVDFL